MWVASRGGIAVGAKGGGRGAVWKAGSGKEGSRRGGCGERWEWGEEK